MKTSFLFLALAGLLLLTNVPAPSALGDELTSPARLSRTVVLRHVTADSSGTVSGTLINRTGLTLRDVKVEVNYAWVWSNDFKPGEDSPGRTVYVTAPATIPPYGQASFSYQPSPPLPSREDGHFVPSVHVIGFTQIGS
jgi:hypothetical protein